MLFRFFCYRPVDTEILRLHCEVDGCVCEPYFREVREYV
jgi:hypothetical protein